MEQNKIDELQKSPSGNLGVKVLFIDRDGTLNIEPDDEQVDSFAKLKFYPRSLYYLSKIATELDFELVMVTNQDGLGTPSNPEENFWPIHNFMIDTFANEGVVFSEIVIDRTFAKDNAPTRKPHTGLLTHYFNEGYDLKNSFVIGDRLNDVILAKNLGAKAIYLRQNDALGSAEALDKYETLSDIIALETQKWEDIYTFLRTGARKVNHVRKTNETDITIGLDLDGTGKANIKTGLNFFDHMLDQIARHGSMNLDVIANGDLHIDEHHTIEDTALALGTAFKEALGDKSGIRRYGDATLPLDEVLVRAAVDLSGRPYLVHSETEIAPMIGTYDTTLTKHIWESFVNSADITLHIKVLEGRNAHHVVEAQFKAVARALRDAVAFDAKSV